VIVLTTVLVSLLVVLTSVLCYKYRRFKADIGAQVAGDDITKMAVSIYFFNYVLSEYMLFALES